MEALSKRHPKKRWRRFAPSLHDESEYAGKHRKFLTRKGSLPPRARPCSSSHGRRSRSIGTVFTIDRNMHGADGRERLRGRSRTPAGRSSRCRRGWQLAKGGLPLRVIGVLCCLRLLPHPWDHVGVCEASDVQPYEQSKERCLEAPLFVRGGHPRGGRSVRCSMQQASPGTAPSRPGGNAIWPRGRLLVSEGARIAASPMARARPRQYASRRRN